MAKTNKAIIFLLVILAIAAFFRLWQLDSIPPGLYPDVAINGNEAISSPGKIFYPENNGREGLFINLIALSFSIFGVTIWSLKIVPAIIGILTVFGLYLLTKELFLKSSEKGSRYIALLSSFFLAVSFWHTNFSRIGFRAILLPFILVFAFYFLFRGFREKKLQPTHRPPSLQLGPVSYLVISGLFFGLGFYTYISYRFIILLLPLVLITFWFAYKRQNLQKQFILHTSYLLLLIFIVALPIAIYFLQNPQDFVGRATPISIFATENPIKEFGKSLILHLGMFNFYGDPNWRHNFAGSPMLLWPIGILFLIGLFYSLRSIVLQSKRLNETVIFLFLVLWLLIMLLPGILTYEGIPHALRTIGVIPVVYIFAGLGGWEIYQWFNKNVKDKKLLIATSIIFLLMVGFLQFDKYFIKWAARPEVEGAFSKDYVEIGNYLNSLPPETPKYVIVNVPGVPVPYPDGIPIPAQTVMFIENIKYGQPRAIYLLPENLDQIEINTKTIIILPMRYDENLFNEFLKRFPQGESQKENEIWLYKINF